MTQDGCGSWNRERVRHARQEHRRESREEREERRRRRRRHRNERVLHTRISEQLAEDIRDLAEGLRVPVSNLVRNVLEDAFSVVEEVGGDMGEVLEDVMEEAENAASRFRRRQERRARGRRGAGRTDAEPSAAPQGAPDDASAAPEDHAEATHDETPNVVPGRADFSEIVAWQPVILNAQQRCEGTGEPIRAGDEAFMGLTADGFSGIYLSKRGLQGLRR